MYIAFKWLICMALAMWTLLCSVDYYKTNLKISEINTHSYTVPVYTKSNVTFHKKLSNNRTKLKFSKESSINSMYIYYLTLLTGVYMISILNRKYDIVLYTKRKIKNISLMKFYNYEGKSTIFKNAAININVAIIKGVELAKLTKTKLMKIIYYFCKSSLLPHPNINFELINKLKIINQERKNLGRLLIAALDESKYIKTKYQLETMATNRLQQYVEDSHKQIKENRSKYISFQQLYLIAHQENIFLKSRVRKLAKEKEDAEKNLVKLVNKIWLSKNSDLKNFCSQLIVETKNNLLNSDVKKEINKFVQKSNFSLSSNVTNKSCEQDTSNSNCIVNESQKPIDISEILDEEYVISLIKNAPEHRSFSRECVWTVKDKDGIIEKLYEYDTNFNKGDSVRRIREYSVYYDKECLLNFSKNTASMNLDRITNLPNECTASFNGNNRFLTESVAFQQFLHNYNFDFYRPKPLAIAQTKEIMAKKLLEIDLSRLSWKHIKSNGLDIEYACLIPKSVASTILKELEESLEYFTGNLAKIKVFGKIYPLPRQQVAYGDPGITYTYSGVTVPALPWPLPVLELRNFLFKLKGIKYDFVLVNKYRNGNDHMGEHRDNEPELDPNFPIASISFGAERPFVLKHKDARKPGPDKKNIPPITINLEHGSILFMNPPTNEVWYHSLPTRKKILGARINLTFRKMRHITK